jgi:hypothetical protein
MRLSYRGNPTKQVLETFLNGHCHSFALALNELTGWPFFGLFDRGNVEWTLFERIIGISDAAKEGVPHHVVLQGPKGLVDVSGNIAGHGLWEGFSAEPISEREVRAIRFCDCDDEACGGPDIALARPIAEWVLAKLNKQPDWFARPTKVMPI